MRQPAFGPRIDTELLTDIRDRALQIAVEAALFGRDDLAERARAIELEVGRLLEAACEMQPHAAAEAPRCADCGAVFPTLRAGMACPNCRSRRPLRSEAEMAGRRAARGAVALHGIAGGSREAPARPLARLAVDQPRANPRLN